MTGGDIKLDGRSIVGELPKNRGVSMIFQSYAVWPHMTVHDNIAYPLKLKKLPKAEIERIVEEVGRTCELTDYMKRYPSQLSGGQRRVWPSPAPSRSSPNCSSWTSRSATSTPNCAFRCAPN